MDDNIIILENNIFKTDSVIEEPGKAYYQIVAYLTDGKVIFFGIYKLTSNNILDIIDKLVRPRLAPLLNMNKFELEANIVVTEVTDTVKSFTIKKEGKQ